MPLRSITIFSPQTLSAFHSRFFARFPRPSPLSFRLFGTTKPVLSRPSKEPSWNNPYAVLGLPNTATKAQAKARYYEIAKRCHPDVESAAEGRGGRNIKKKGNETNSPSFLAAKAAYETIVRGTWRPPDETVSSSPFSTTDRKSDEKVRSAYWYGSTTRWYDAGPEERRRFMNETFEERDRPRSRVRPDVVSKDVGPLSDLPWWKTFLYALRDREGWSWAVLGFGTFTVFAMLVPVVPEKPPPEVTKGRNGRWVVVPRTYPWTYVPGSARNMDRREHN